ncbi:hypothetical protein N0V93_010367 [Gnomoniopsis smithogilvyi]|uniref:Uncharacterized protein n=1 Tax=Gnomoniopsis smithogilvyi TaxID=1191159 RepID=A0A9W9CSP2_9PEZI|nr:hypothetical protein N0V93_010367 [Gnomoniopsis smithogilvyi]
MVKHKVLRDVKLKVQADMDESAKRPHTSPVVAKMFGEGLLLIFLDGNDADLGRRRRPGVQEVQLVRDNISHLIERMTTRFAAYEDLTFLIVGPKFVSRISQKPSDTPLFITYILELINASCKMNLRAATPKQRVPKDLKNGGDQSKDNKDTD